MLTLGGAEGEGSLSRQDRYFALLELSITYKPSKKVTNFVVKG